MDTCLGVALFRFIICRDLPLILLKASLGFLVSRRFKTGFQWGILKHQPDMLLCLGGGGWEKSPLCPPHQKPWHALRADGQVENQLCIAGSRQAGLPPRSREREPVRHPFRSGKYKGMISSQNIISLVGLLEKCTSTLPSDKAIAPKDERHAALRWHTSAFLPLLFLQKSCLHKAERVCRRRCGWRIIGWEDLRRTYKRCLSTIKSRQKMVWHRDVSHIVLESTGLCIQCHPAALSKESNRGICLIRDFFFLSMNYTILLLQYIIHE